MITVEGATDEDLVELRQWAKARDCVLEEALLSPHGFVAWNDNDERVMCAFAAFVMDVPVVLVDHVFVPPRFNPTEAREAWVSILSAIRTWVDLVNSDGGFQYSVIEIVANPVMEREIKKTGGQVSSATYKKARYVLTRTEEHDGD